VNLFQHLIEAMQDSGEGAVFALQDGEGSGHGLPPSDNRYQSPLQGAPL
jgi:hypothetical protein